MSDSEDPSYPGRDLDQVFKADYQHVEGRDCTKCDLDQTVYRLPRASDDPVVHYGLIASGNMAIESAQLRDHLCHSWGALCFEMEAAGLMDYFPCLVIRGICDYSDTHKTKVWQPYAAVTAAAYAKDLLRVIGPRQVAKTEVATSILQDVITKLDHVDGDVRQIRKTVDDAYKARVMDWICPMDYSSQQSDFFAQHEEGTGNWLLTSESFQKWLHGSNQILLGEVIPGTGKTILTSIVINYLQTYFDQNNDVGIAYIFCNFRQQHEQTLNGLLACVLKQLCQQQAEIPECVDGPYKGRRKGHTLPTQEEILNMYLLLL
ncbi:hypothetical protein ASPWEDRAFT_472012 [Aspergillus wentii DTO 134E9]|uniref:Nephrocystin 3-like N-terminal domain-containing protein n=1 Tax=Aspergillus wentii DTO 134E9 TaxID=1073089 RepID=A0A1L9RSP5_ASPWE|nr:uncharacterized protein ASPWEDRAFT_472012 [Aspergillus wentii DTO 134E9]OJJ37903.1 hypothetical protein ASPWEDRAFT_472012 [Aspergillus wentii DTO 134E9]